MATKSSKPPLINISEEKTDLRKTEPPLIDVKVTNPVTYLKSWWKKVMGNEGLDFRFKVKPLTAIAISIIVVTVSMGVGRFVLPFNIPFFEYTSDISSTPTPTPNPWRDTAFSGELRFFTSTKRYYLFTSNSEAITLEAPENIDLSQLIGVRIFATGSYNQTTRTLKVIEASNLEILPKEVEPLPTIVPTPSPTPSPLPTELPTNSSSSAHPN